MEIIKTKPTFITSVLKVEYKIYVSDTDSKNAHLNFRTKFGNSGHCATCSTLLLMCTDSTLQSAHETAECMLLLYLCTVPSYQLIFVVTYNMQLCTYSDFWVKSNNNKADWLGKNGINQANYIYFCQFEGLCCWYGYQSFEFWSLNQIDNRKYQN